MLFRQLEYFEALARERHFARAANACHISQPALSEAIRKIEHELKVPLVRRGQSFDGLTPEGERLVLWARRILADRDPLKEEVAAMQDRPVRRAAPGDDPGGLEHRGPADRPVLC
jgi:DNA-binding transcriptional LysR family regulator